MNNKKPILSELVSGRNIDLFFWSCVLFLFLLLILNLQEVILVQAWRHDALYYMGSYSGKLSAEGRWINYFLFSYLKSFPAQVSVLLNISFFGGFVWIAANKILSWKKSLLIALLFLQINPIWSVIHWPATILPAHFFLFFCAFFSRKYRYEPILFLGGILFHGTMNNLYNLIPLIFLCEIKTCRQLFRFLAFWIVFYMLGFMVAEFMTKVIVGQFIHIASWRQPNYVTSMTTLVQNLKMIYKYFVSHIHIFTLTSFMLCISTTVCCLRKKIINVYQVFCLLCVGVSCYAQALPLGIRIDLRTVYCLYAALLLPLCFSLLCKKFCLLVLVAIIALGARMFMDNYNSLRYYNGIVSVWTEHLRTIPNDPRLNSQLIFLSDTKDTSDIEKHLMKTMALNNQILERLDTPGRWSPSAESIGYHVKCMRPKWLEKCKFYSNQLYEWAYYNGIIVVRFNTDLIKLIRNKRYVNYYEVCK